MLSASLIFQSELGTLWKDCGPGGRAVGRNVAGPACRLTAGHCRSPQVTAGRRRSQIGHHGLLAIYLDLLAHVGVCFDRSCSRYGYFRFLPRSAQLLFLDNRQRCDRGLSIDYQA